MGRAKALSGHTAGRAVSGTAARCVGVPQARRPLLRPARSAGCKAWQRTAAACVRTARAETMVGAPIHRLRVPYALRTLQVRHKTIHSLMKHSIALIANQSALHSMHEHIHQPVLCLCAYTNGTLRARQAKPPSKHACIHA